MRRVLAIIIFVVGLVLVMGVVIAGAEETAPAAAPQIAQLPPEGAEFVGSNTCFQCHSAQYRTWQTTLHSKMIQDAAMHPEAILADFSTGEDVRQDGYTAEDVTFTMGNKDRQRYIMQTGDGYTVLSGQWDIASQTWVEAESADWLSDCAGCHTTGFNVEDHSWSETSVTCEACHGPASQHVEMAMALPEGIDPQSEDVYAVRGAIVATVDGAVCGQCHNVGTSPDGEHGYPVGFQVGGALDESHIVLAEPTGEEDDPNFWPDGTEKSYRGQYNAWLQSRHGNALATIQENDHASDSCLSCHSTDFNYQDATFPQDAVTLENAQFSITCVECHAPHGGAEAQNQLSDEAYNLCVSCHTGTGGGNTPIRVGGTVHHPMREMFEGISFLGLDPNPSPHFANEAYGPICSSCHMVGTGTNAVLGDVSTHTWHIVNPEEAAEGQPNPCQNCHTLERSEDNTAENLAFAIESVQEDTQERVEDLRADLTDITDAHPEWDPQAEEKPEAQQIAERIHTLVSFVEADGSWGFHNPGYTDDILSEAEDLLDDLLDMEEG